MINKKLTILLFCLCIFIKSNLFCIEPNIVNMYSAISVNGEIITDYDIIIRSKLMKGILNNYNGNNKSFITRYNQSDIMNNITDDIIKEKLKIMEAKKYNIDATEKEIKQGIEIIASKFGFNVKQLQNIMRNAGCSEDIWINNKINICYQMMFSDVLWAKFSGMFFSSMLSNYEKEVDQELKRYTDYINFVVTDLNISQIILNSKSDADGMFNKIKGKNCTEFNKEIVNGLPGSGNLGFIKLHETSKIVGEHIKDLEIGVVSHPLKNIDNKYYLYIICDKRTDKTLSKNIVPIKDMKERISNAIVNNKLDSFSTKHLEKLFNSAFIEYM